jgi:hypothetical protein
VIKRENQVDRSLESRSKRVHDTPSSVFGDHYNLNQNANEFNDHKLNEKIQQREIISEINVNLSLDVYPDGQEEKKDKENLDNESLDSEEEQKHLFYKPLGKNVNEKLKNIDGDETPEDHEKAIDNLSSIKTLQEKQRKLLELYSGVDFTMVHRSIQEVSELSHKETELKKILEIYSLQVGEENIKDLYVSPGKDANQSDDSDSDDNATRDFNLVTTTDGHTDSFTVHREPNDNLFSNSKMSEYPPVTHQNNKYVVYPDK